MNWLHRGACVGQDPELFFPIGSTGPALRQIEEAKEVCSRCEVVDACLQWALDTGVWGGLSEDERGRLKRRMSRSRIRAEARPAAPLSRDLMQYVRRAPGAERRV